MIEIERTHHMKEPGTRTGMDGETGRTERSEGEARGSRGIRNPHRILKNEGGRVTTVDLM